MVYGNLKVWGSVIFSLRDFTMTFPLALILLCILNQNVISLEVTLKIHVCRYGCVVGDWDISDSLMGVLGERSNNPQ